MGNKRGARQQKWCTGMKKLQKVETAYANFFLNSDKNEMQQVQCVQQVHQVKVHRPQLQPAHFM